MLMQTVLEHTIPWWVSVIFPWALFIAIWRISTKKERKEAERKRHMEAVTKQKAKQKQDEILAKWINGDD